MKIVRAGSGSEVYSEKCLIPGQNPVVLDTVESLGYLLSDPLQLAVVIWAGVWLSVEK